MWFNDIDIEQRHPSWPRPIESVAPERHQATLDRYLERQRRWEAERQRHQARGEMDALKSWIEAVTAGAQHLMSMRFLDRRPLAPWPRATLRKQRQ
jgi:hypothetical protein